MSSTSRLVSIVVASALVFAACGSDTSTPTNPDPPDPPTPPAPNVLPTARIAASLEEGTVPLVVTFDGRSSTDSDGTVVSYAWTFGDGSTGTGAEVTHTFTSVGLFAVELTVRDDRGGEHSAKDSVYATSPPGSGSNTIQGIVWFDRDLSGSQDAGEPGLDRFVVFLDDNGNDAHDAGEALTFTATDGSYEFAGLDGSRSYAVTQALPFGWSNTDPGPAPTGAVPAVRTGPVPAASIGPVPVQPTGPPPPEHLTAARIIAGQETDIGPFPFQVALLINDFQFCGGTLINAEYVLSAAHCLVGTFPIDLEVLIGTAELSSGGERVGVEALRIHPEFNNTLDYDVALLRLDRRLLRPRVFLQTPDQPSLSLPGKTATVIGWGQTENGTGSPRLKRTEVDIITNVACTNSAGIFFGSIGPRTICAGAERLGTGPCFGDSGGPLLVPHEGTWAQVGIVSFSVNVDQCGNVPGAYSRVAELYEYIFSVARIESSGTRHVDWSAGPIARADFGNFH